MQTDTGKGPNTRDGKGPSDSYHKTRKTCPIHQPNKKTTQDTKNTGPWKERELCAMHVLLKTKEQV
jgi:hypothetical protein